MRKNRKLSVCKAAIFELPAKQDIVLKIKEMCHLEHKTPEQMPFNLFGYLIYFSRYEGKSEMSVFTAAILNFPAKKYIVLKIKKLCNLEHKTPEQMPFKILRYLI